MIWQIICMRSCQSHESVPALWLPRSHSLPCFMFLSQRREGDHSWLSSCWQDMFASEVSHWKLCRDNFGRSSWIMDVLSTWFSGLCLYNCRVLVHLWHWRSGEIGTSHYGWVQNNPRSSQSQCFFCVWVSRKVCGWIFQSSNWYQASHHSTHLIVSAPGLLPPWFVLLLSCQSVLLITWLSYLFVHASSIS